MRLIVELPADAYERFREDPRRPIIGPLGAVEVRQEGGLLSTEAPARRVEALGLVAASKEGVPPGAPAIRVWLRPPEEGGSP